MTYTRHNYVEEQREARLRADQIAGICDNFTLHSIQLIGRSPACVR